LSLIPTIWCLKLWLTKCLEAIVHYTYYEREQGVFHRSTLGK